MSGEVVIARGARAAEAVVLDAVREHIATRRADPTDPGRLDRPLRIVVPSRSLREHLAATLVRECGAVAGVAIQTLHGLAAEVLRRSGEALVTGDLLFPAIVRRAAREQPLLWRALAELDDGFGAAVASVADLFDAGFQPTDAAPLDELLAERGGAEAERVRALVRTASRTRETLESLGLVHRSERLVRAAERLQEAESPLPPADFLLHGFADATGVATDLLRVLVVRHGARAVIDRPPDPADPAAEDAGARFSDRLLAELSGLARVSEQTAQTEPGTIVLLRAPGAHAEARAVAERARVAIESGVAPERIGIVVRHLESHALPLRVQLRRLGVPFSGGPGATGPLGPAGRRLRALLDLLRLRERAHADRWLDVLRSVSRDRRADLRLAFHVLGTPRLRDVQALDVGARLAEASSLALPVRSGLDAPENDDDEDSDTLRARRRRLGREALEEAVARARSLCTLLAAAPDPRPLAEHLTRLRTLCSDELGWRASDPGARALAPVLEGLARGLSGAFSLAADDFCALLERALRGVGRDALGGAGAGVQVLSVTEARARSFERLFVLGLNRDLFPRVIVEDPLFRDSLRRAVLGLLPALPDKARGFEEERYLFAELVSASPELVLLCQAVSDDGKERTPSPLFERVRLARGAAEPPLAPGLLEGGGDAARFRTPQEHALRRALGAGGGARLVPVLGLALREAHAAVALPLDAETARTAARARVALLGELERAGDPKAELGPFFGAVGPRATLDARDRDPYVTTLERLAGCPWRTFLERVLRLEPPPDARSTLPSLTPLLVGNLLHAVLERIALEAGVPAGGTLEDALARDSRVVPWPEPAKLETLLREEAEHAVREAGIALPGFAAVLVARTRPALERARDLDWGAAGRLSGVLGVEVSGHLVLAHEARVLRFRADRLDEGPRLTDYKSGKSPSKAKGDDTRAAALRKGIAQGVWLQGAAYALASGGEGRYLFANPKLEAGTEEYSLGAEEIGVRDAFEAATSALLEAWEGGHFPPRLLQRDLRNEPDACSWCAVAEACVRGDSGARGRLRRWLEVRADAAPADADEARLLTLWRLPEQR